MANYIVNSDDLTLVADSIRSKGNTNGTLVWPTGFKNAIDNISVDVKDICIKTTDFDDVVKVDDAAALGARDVVAKIEPVQDLHGYDHPWIGGAGKNKLQTTGTSTVINGVTFTVNDDGSIVVNGTATANANFYVNGNSVKSFGGYLFNGCPDGGSNTTYFLEYYDQTASKSTRNTGSTDETIPSDMDGHECRIVVSIRKGYTASNVVFRPMLRLATEADATFAPYSNICPISGWTGAEVYRRGKNLLNAESPDYTDTLIGTDGSININQNYNSWRLSAVGTFTLSIIVTERINSGRVVILNSDNNVSAAIAIPLNIGLQYVTFSLSFGQYALICIRKSATDYQLELGSTATTYEPYQGDTFSVTFPSEAGTVYGGTVDLTKGKLVVDRAMVDMGTLAWGFNGVRFDAFLGGVSLAYTRLKGICSMYPVANTSVADAPDKSLIFSNTNEIVYVKDSAYADAAAFKTAMSGAQLVYNLENTLTYNLTPQEIAMFKGTNILSSTTGKTQLKYFTEAFEPLAEEIGFVNGGDY